MSHRGRKTADDAILIGLARGQSIRQVAKRTDVSERTINRRLQDPAFRNRLQELKEKLIDQTATRLTGIGMKAVRTLNKLMADGVKAEVRLGAARAALALAAEWRTNQELAEQIAALEEAQNREKR